MDYGYGGGGGYGGGAGGDNTMMYVLLLVACCCCCALAAGGYYYMNNNYSAPAAPVDTSATTDAPTGGTDAKSACVQLSKPSTPWGPPFSSKYCMGYCAWGKDKKSGNAQLFKAFPAPIPGNPDKTGWYPANNTDCATTAILNAPGVKPAPIKTITKTKKGKEHFRAAPYMSGGMFGM